VVPRRCDRGICGNPRHTLFGSQSTNQLELVHHKFGALEAYSVLGHMLRWDGFLQPQHRTLFMSYYYQQWRAAGRPKAHQDDRNPNRAVEEPSDLDHRPHVPPAKSQRRAASDDMERHLHGKFAFPEFEFEGPDAD
jgi:hypothetical protein